jgi:hypothetical protein
MKARLTAKQRAGRDKRVVDFFLAGLSHRQVAAKVGLSHTMVQKIVRRDLDERMEQREAVGEAMVLAERQNELLKAHWTGALGGDVQSSRIVLQVLRMQEKAVERSQLSSAIAEVVDAEVVDDEPQQRAIGEARRLTVVPDYGSDVERDRGPDLDLLATMRRARAGDPEAQLRVTEASRRYETEYVPPEQRTWRS